MFKPRTRTRKNRSLFYGRIGPYILTLRFDLGDNFGPKLAHCPPLVMDWANPIDPVKSIKSNPKMWVGSDNWVDMCLKKEKPTQKIGFQTKPDLTQKTH
jgi:hypothetical protein